MVNLHIGGAISVFFVCVGLLISDRWFNDGEKINLQLSETDGGRLESAEFVFAPPRQFYFSQQPGTKAVEKVSEAMWFPATARVDENGDSRVQSIQPKFAPDSKIFAADIE
jgi:hypothetical protein